MGVPSRHRHGESCAEEDRGDRYRSKQHVGSLRGWLRKGASARRTGVLTSRCPERVQDGAGDHAVPCQPDGDGDSRKRQSVRSELVSGVFHGSVPDSAASEAGPGCVGTGVKVSDEELAAVPLDRHEFHGDWNYTIKPPVTAL